MKPVRPKRFALILLSIVMLAVSSTAQSQPPELKRGQTIVKDLKGGEAHSYAVKLKAGQYAQLAVEQRGIDVVAAVFDPAGKPLGEFDSPTGLGGTEQVRFVAEAAGDYRIEVRSLKAEAYGGSYAVKLETISRATAQDKRI